MSTKIRLKMDDLTIGDMEVFEEATGKDLMETLKPVPVIDPETGRAIPDPDNKGKPMTEVRMSTKALLGIIFVALRKEDPTVTPDDVRAMKLADIDFELEESVSAEDPTTAPESS